MENILEMVFPANPMPVMEQKIPVEPVFACKDVRPKYRLEGVAMQPLRMNNTITLPCRETTRS